MIVKLYIASGNGLVLSGPNDLRLTDEGFAKFRASHILLPTAWGK